LRPKVLFLVRHLPLPAISGGRLREYELLKALSGQVDLTLCAVTRTYDLDVEWLTGIESLCSAVYLEPSSVSSGSTGLQGPRRWSGRMAIQLKHMIAHERFDVVHIEGHFLESMLPASARPPVLLVEQNIESQVLARQNNLQLVRGALDPGELSRLEDIERAAWKRADACGALSEVDANFIRQAIPNKTVFLIPDGGDHIAQRPISFSRSDSQSIVYVGNFDYAPSEDGAMFLLTHIWPLVSDRHPEVTLRIVGNQPSKQMKSSAARFTNVEITGWVDRVEPYLDEATIAVVPLRIGGGVKVKTLEAMRRGCAIVSTSIGVEGIDVGNGAIICDDPVTFGNKVILLLEDNARRSDMEYQSRLASSRIPEWSDVGDKLLGAYDHLIRTAEGYRNP
jgi:polysaccharide biosynthesis protein PslH